MYNLKVTKFPSGVTRVQYYEYVVSPSEKEKKSEKLVENPFNSDLVREVEQFSDRSILSVSLSAVPGHGL